MACGYFIVLSEPLPAVSRLVSPSVTPRTKLYAFPGKKLARLSDAQAQGGPEDEPG